MLIKRATVLEWSADRLILLFLERGSVSNKKRVYYTILNNFVCLFDPSIETLTRTIYFSML
jgi:hypothetical protein